MFSKEVKGKFLFFFQKMINIDSLLQPLLSLSFLSLSLSLSPSPLSLTTRHFFLPPSFLSLFPFWFHFESQIFFFLFCKVHFFSFFFFKFYLPFVDLINYFSIINGAHESINSRLLSHFFFFFYLFFYLFFTN